MGQVEIYYDEVDPNDLALVRHVTTPLVLTAQYLAGTLQLNFPALSGVTYRVKYCEDLALGNWVLLQKVRAAQAGSATVLGTLSSRACDCRSQQRSRTAPDSVLGHTSLTLFSSS